MNGNDEYRLASLLLPNAPLSSNIFQRGFYFDEDELICYRHSIQDVLMVPLKQPWAWFCFFFFSFTFLYPVYWLSDLSSDKKLNCAIFVLGVESLFTIILLVSHVNMLVFNPLARYDVSDKILYDCRGALFNESIPFSGIRYLVVLKGIRFPRRSYRATVSVITTLHSLVAINHFCYRNTFYLEVFVRNIQHIIGNNVEIIETDDPNEIVDLFDAGTRSVRNVKWGGMYKS